MALFNVNVSVNIPPNVVELLRRLVVAKEREVEEIVALGEEVVAALNNIEADLTGLLGGLTAEQKEQVKQILVGLRDSAVRISNIVS